jgi:Protein of unknown function (DUF3313)
MREMKKRESGWNSSRMVIYVMSLAAVLTFGWGLSGCSQTTEPQNSVIQQLQSAPRPVTAFSGFLGDYTLLKVGGKGQAQYRYVDPNANWSQYNSIIIEPVTFWAGDDSKVPADQQQILTEYFYNTLRDQMAKHFTVVDEPGPGVMRLQAALTDAESATPVLRTISVVVPQARVLSKVGQLATGSFSFVGGARAEGRLTDSQSGVILGEWVDERLGSNAVRNAATWQWQDAKRAMDYWATTLADRLAQAQAGQQPQASTDAPN